MTLRQGWDSVLHSGIATFMGAPLLEKVEEAELRKRNIKAGVIGIPFDSTTITRTGSTMGPRAIRDAGVLSFNRYGLIRRYIHTGNLCSYSLWNNCT